MLNSVNTAAGNQRSLELVKFGSCYTDIKDFHEVLNVALMGMQGDYRYYRRINNPPLRCYFKNIKKNTYKELAKQQDFKFHRFPKDSSDKSYLNGVLDGFHPPLPDDPWLMVSMPEIGALAESTIRTKIYATMMIEAELKMHFFTDLP